MVRMVRDVAAVVLAAGAGRRMQGSINKVFLLAGGKPILTRSLELFEDLDEVKQIVLVCAQGELALARSQIVEPYELLKVRTLAVGGPTRHHSEYIGLQSLAPEIESGSITIVLVHDGVRPFVRPQLIRDLIAEARRHGAAIPAVRAGTDIVSVDANGFIQPSDGDLWVAQTPQAFDARLLLEAHRRAEAEGFIGTDTASVVERTGHVIRVLEGDYDNVKITTSDDLVLAEQVATWRVHVTPEQGMHHV